MDLNTAGPKTLLRHGFPYRRPTADDLPEVRSAWKLVFGRETPLKLITPELRPRPGVTHHLRRRLSPNNQNTDYSGGQWAGGVIAPAAGAFFTAATATFNVPTVSKPQPSEKAGTEGGWHCSTWVGLDGMNGGAYTGSNDVLQAGVDQRVDDHGNTSCYAWFEWFVKTEFTGGIETISTNTSTLADLTPLNRSIDAVNGRLYLARKSESGDGIIITHSDDGHSFSAPANVLQASVQAPTICEWNGGLYMAWRGEGVDYLNVAQVALDKNSGDVIGLMNVVQLGDTSQSGPTLCSLGSSLFLAW